MNALRGDDRERGREALFKRGGALEFQEDRGRDNSLAPLTELAKRQTLHSRRPVSPPRWCRRGPSKWASSKHHHFMQWRVISSERSQCPDSSPLLSYQIFSHSGVWTKIFGHLSYISSPSFDRRRRSPRIPFCSEFCDRRPVRPRQVARSTDGRTHCQRHSNCHRPTGEPIPKLWSGPIFFASSIGKGRRAGGPAAQVGH